MCDGYGGTRSDGAGAAAMRAAGGGREAIQVPVACIGPAAQPRTMKFMLYFSLHKRKP